DVSRMPSRGSRDLYHLPSVPTRRSSDLPGFALGYFWDTPLGWTSVLDTVPVNKDSVQFASLAGFFRDEPAVPVPPEDNVYVRFAGYSLVGSMLAPLVGAYSSFVLINVAVWVAAV